MISAVEEAHEEIEKMGSALDEFRNAQSHAEEQAHMYKSKYEEVHELLGGSQEQIREFDNINQMSSKLIDQLQTQVDHL